MTTAKRDTHPTEISSLTAPAFLHWLGLRRKLRPLLLEALSEALTLGAARAATIATTAEELQVAANNFRRRHGLGSAEATYAWLEREGLSIEDFEEALERDLLVEKFVDHLAAGDEAPLAARLGDYDRARLGQILVGREDLACELLSQVRDEGAAFAELARRHSLRGPQPDGAVVFRKQMPPDLDEKVFGAHPGAVVGPTADPQGFLLLRVEEVLPARPEDPATRSLLRRDLYEAWLRDKLEGVRLPLPPQE